MDTYQDFPIRQDLSFFNFLFILSQVFGGIAIVLVVAWGAYYNQGFAGPSSPGQWFNWHPLLMTLGLIAIQGDSILIYRALRNEAKPRLKSIHAALHFVAFVFVVVGLKAVFDSHNYAKTPIPNLYSLHSWIGISAVIMFAVQFLAGFVSFLYPRVRKSLRSRYLPLHVLGGTMIFILSTCAALMGITEKNIFNKDYHKLPAGAQIGNALGVCIVIFVMLVFYLVSQPAYKRIALAEEQVLPLDYSEEENTAGNSGAIGGDN